MCWRNGIWHPCVKIASPANTFAIISLVQRRVAQAALQPPYGARRQHLHEGWAGEGKLQLLWLAFLQGLLHYHNVVREHDGCVNWHLWCEGEASVSLHGSSTATFFLSICLPVFHSYFSFFLEVFTWFFLPFSTTASLCFCMCVRISSSRPTQAGQGEPSLCQSDLQGPAPSRCSQPPWVCLCALTYSISVFSCHSMSIFPLHVTIPLFTRPHMQRHSDPLCDFCHFKHPLLQCSVTEHLPYGDLLMSDPPERGGTRSRRRRRISWVFIFSSAVPPVPC